MTRNVNALHRDALAGGTFAKELRAARGGSSQTATACRVGYSASHYSNVENGHKPPTFDFARACDIAFDTGSRFVELYEAECLPTHRKTPARPAQLPPVPRLIGRTGVFDVLERFLDHEPSGTSADVIALDGNAGVGKTTLAVAWAHHVKNRFPDGALFVDLHGHAAEGEPIGPHEVLEHLLKALGVPPAEIPATLDWRSALLRTVLDGTRTLLVFDNAARFEQVRPLIPASPGCLVIVTSRQRLSGLAVHYSAHCLTVDMLGDADSVALLRDVVGPERVDAERIAAERIARLCGGLPLAVRVAAERVAASSHLTLTGLAEDLAKVGQRLDVLSPPATDGAVRAVLSWSYRALSPAESQLFRLLSVHPGREFGADAAAAITGHQHGEVQRLLDGLVGVHLLQESGVRRYRFHDLVRDYAVELLAAEEAPADAATAERQLLYWYLHSAAAANLTMSPNRPQVPVDQWTISPMPTPRAFVSSEEALRWFDTELPNLAAAVRHASTLGFHDVAFGLPTVLGDYLYWRHCWGLWLEPLTACLEEARRCGDRTAQAWILINLGNAFLEQLRLSEAEHSFSEAAELHDGGIGKIWGLVGVGRVQQAKGHHAAAASYYCRALQLCTDPGSQWSWAVVTSYIADTERAAGRHQTALDMLTEAIGILRTHGDPQAQACALERVSEVYYDRGDHAASLAHLEKALEASASAADRWGRAEYRRKLGHRYLEAGDRARARQAWTEAQREFEALGDPRAARIRGDLDSLDQLAVPTPRQAG
ncbi:NB-ARC domain-containing protein [Saccharothrix sp.]|uniref:NB-ARC domain-containing protein n=1 Tax=Saccharothrix sp. TaxID=1873460 RepID=UPI0028118512|nr:NB-ARC domain-containing protein [Saccharothrix sp.]